MLRENAAAQHTAGLKAWGSLNGCMHPMHACMHAHLGNALAGQPALQRDARDVQQAAHHARTLAPGEGSRDIAQQARHVTPTRPQ